MALAILLAGSCGLAAVLVAPPAIITYYGWTPYESVVTAIRTDTTAVATIAGMSAGLAATLAGFGLYRRMATKSSRERAIAGAVLGVQAVAAGALFLWFRSGDPERFARNFLNFDKLEGSRAYINFFRGTPLIWQLGAGYFFIVLGLGIRITTFRAALLIFVLNTAAYAAEVFRAGIQSVERGQMEAARSLGMSYLQAMRYAIVPQAFRRVIPPLTNEFVILVKDTSLIVVLGLLQSEYDLYQTAREGYSSTANATFFVAAAAGYLAVTLPMIRVVNILERRLRSGLVGAEVPAAVFDRPGAG
ncbi:MAG: amino acid ABC transporter permease [Actinobacteria bacterium]|nr:amino acid ABC transporter permease [Actinomycetota bacterium]